MGVRREPIGNYKVTRRELDSSDAAAVSGAAPQKIVVPDTAAG